MARYYHSFPTIRKRRIDYSNLFSPEDKAKMRYNRDMSFKTFVDNKRSAFPNQSWSLADLNTAYEKGGLQLAFAF